MRKLKEKTRKDANKQKKINKLVVPDTSIIVQGTISKELKNRKIKFEKILIHEAVMAELESQANKRKESGFLGLDEIKRIRELSRKNKFEIEFVGNRPGDFEIKFAKSGEIDSLIRELAEKHDATLLTSDLVQGKVSLAKGLSVKIYDVLVEQSNDLLIEKFFSKNTVSVHLKENCFPKIKSGSPGSWVYTKRNKKITREELDVIHKELMESAKNGENNFFESDKRKNILLKVKNMKILITRPPVTSSFEITASSPVKKARFEDYKINNSLKKHLLKKAKGIMIIGKDGEGKSSFAEVLIKKYEYLKKNIKTIEDSRNINFSNTSRLGSLQSSSSEIKEMILFDAPDFVLFDEIKNQEDMKLITEISSAGTKVVGVMKSSDHKIAIRKMLEWTNTSVFENYFDTIIFISKGEIKKVLCPSLEIKKSINLGEGIAKPIIFFNDFFTNKVQYEAYKLEGEFFVFSIK